MQGRRWMLVATIGVAMVVVGFVADVLLGAGLSKSAAAAMGFVVLIGAVLAAGACYQRWSTVVHRETLTHAMAAAALLGGALVASSVFGATGENVFHDTWTASLGVAALLVALGAAHLTTDQKDPR